jgi:uroporphyrinogen decarboxylase
MGRRLLGLPAEEGASSRVGERDLLSSLELNEVMGLDNLQVRFLPPIFAEFTQVNDMSVPAHPLIRTRSDLNRMIFPDPDDPELFRAAEGLIAQNQGRFAVGASLRTGISAAHMSMGVDGISYALTDDPGLVDTVLGRYADWAIAIVRRLRDMGVDYVWTFDDMAYKSGSLFSPRTFRSVFMPHMRRVADAIRAERLPWILHSDGDLTHLLDDLLDLGINGLHPIEPGAMDIGMLKQKIGDRVCLVGNIDLDYTLTQGTPAEVEAEVRERIATVGPGGGYMISSANSITFYCKLENVRTMIAAIRMYAGY